MLKGLGNLGDMAKMMAKAQEFQGKMAEAQAAVEALEVEGEAGAGLVKATVTGKGELKRLEGMSSAKVKPELQQWMSRRCAPPSAACCGRRLLCLTRESGRGRKKILSQLADKEL